MNARVLEHVADALDGRWFRGKGRLLHALCPRSGVVSRRVFGVPLLLDLSDWVQRSIFLGTYEPGETRIVRKYLQPGMVVVDVGANVGYYTLLARALVGPTGRVIAIEPSERLRSRLQSGAGQFANVTIVDAAMGATAGEGTLAVDPLAGNDTPTLVARGNGLAERVAIRTLDECLSTYGIAAVDLLKIDVEGWEPNVLAGARQLLEMRRVRAMLCEFNSYWLTANGSSPQSLWRTLRRFGFVDTESGRREPSFRPDGNETRFFVMDRDGQEDGE